jgi:hypothetical protein
VIDNVFERGTDKQFAGVGVNQFSVDKLVTFALTTPNVNDFDI